MLTGMTNHLRHCGMLGFNSSNPALWTLTWLDTTSSGQLVFARDLKSRTGSSTKVFLFDAFPPRKKRKNIHNFSPQFSFLFFQPKGYGVHLPRFDVSVKEGTTMLWKAASVQLKNIKVKNVGSYFPASQIEDSEAMFKDRVLRKKKSRVLRKKQ